MSIAYLAEHADLARLALELAERESRHLRYTWQTLYKEPIDLSWVENLEKREDLAEKIDVNYLTGQPTPLRNPFEMAI